MSPAMISPPPRIPGFTYVRDLGHGGFADVYLYAQETPRREVAVKVLHSEMAGSEAAARLNKEADAMAGLSQHQNIVTVLQSGTAADGRPYLVMEYYPGPALSQGLRQTQRSLASALRIGIQLAGAIESAHRFRVDGSGATGQGILHRDIKPANILVDRWGRPVLGDFGIAMSSAEAQRGGAQGMSIPWSPPEAFDRDPHPSPQSDVWSLAATVYALLTGRAPFEIPDGNNQAHAMIDRIRNQPYQPLGRVDAPASLDQVLSTALAKSPQARYGSMKAFGLALREVEAELGLPPTQMDILDDSADERLGGGDDDVAGTSLRPITLIDPTGASTGRGAVSTGPGTGSALWPSVPPAASPAAPPTTAPPVPVTAVLDRTQLRAPATTAALDQTQLRPVAVAERPVAAVPEPPAPPRPVWRFVLVGIAIVVIVGVVLAIVLLGKPPVPESTPTTAPAVPHTVEGGAALPPAPENVTGVAGPAAGQATFTWTNPDPQPGDRYRVTVVGSPDTKPLTTSETTITLDLTPGASWTCISVMTVRGGVGSAHETQGCLT